MTLELISIGELMYLVSRCWARPRKSLIAPSAGRPDLRPVRLATQKLLAATRGASTLERWAAARIASACRTVVNTSAFEHLVLLAVRRVRKNRHTKGGGR